jgi:hypothetical protein
MFFFLVNNDTLALSLAVDPSALKNLAFSVDVFTDSMLNVILVDSLKLGTVRPAIGAVAVFFAIQEVSFIDFAAFVKDSPFSIQVVLFESALICESGGVIFALSVLNSIQKLPLICRNQIILSPDLPSKPIW